MNSFSFISSQKHEMLFLYKDYHSDTVRDTVRILSGYCPDTVRILWKAHKAEN